jgi:hypothetical protein
MLRRLLCGSFGSTRSDGQAEIVSPPTSANVNASVPSSDRQISPLAAPNVFVSVATSPDSRLIASSLVQQGAANHSASGYQALFSLTEWEDGQTHGDFILKRPSDQEPRLSARLTHVADGLDHSLVNSIVESLGPQLLAGLSRIAESFLSADTTTPTLQIQQDLPPSIKGICISPAYVKDRVMGSLLPCILLEITLYKQTASSPVLIPHAPDRMEKVKQSPSAVRSDANHTSDKQGSLLRAGAMISAIPCIATLMELHPTSDDFYSSPGQLFSGRILMQNELSLAYWGKLDQLGCDGSWHLLKILLGNEDDSEASISSLAGYLKRSKHHSGQLPIWQQVINVYASLPVAQLPLSSKEAAEHDQTDSPAHNSAFNSRRGLSRSMRSNSLSMAASSLDTSQQVPSLSTRQVSQDEISRTMTVAPSKAMMSMLNSLEQNDISREIAHSTSVEKGKRLLASYSFSPSTLSRSECFESVL